MNGRTRLSSFVSQDFCFFNNLKHKHTGVVLEHEVPLIIQRHGNSLVAPQQHFILLRTIPNLFFTDFII
jgi:hypothetical protein